MKLGRLWRAAVPGALSSASGVGLLATSGWLITRASERPPVLSLCVAIGAVQAFSLARGLFRYLERLGSHGLSLELLGELRLRLYDLLEPRVPGAIGGASTAQALSGLVSDADEVAQGFAQGLGAWVDLTSSALAGTLVASLVEPRLGLFVLAGALAVAAVATSLSRYSARAAGQAAAQRAQLVGLVVETLRAARELVAYERQDLLQQRLDEARNRSRRLALTSSLASGATKAAAVALTGASLVAVVGAALAAHDAGHLSGPLVAVAAFATLAALDQSAALPAAQDAIAARRASAARIEALAATPAVAEPAGSWHQGFPPGPAGATGAGQGPPSAPLGAGPPAAALEDAHVGPPGDAEVLKGVSLAVGAGQRVALFGRSGAGKTTAIYALLHFVECSAGRAALRGADVRGLSRLEIAQQLAWLPDETHVFSASLADNLRIARPEATDDECTAALAQAGLSRWFASLPEGLATPLGAGGRPMSGGERQRLGMARALLGGGQVLLLDEPTARLDPAMSAQVLPQLLGAARGRSVLVVSHEPAVAELVDEVVVLSGGEVLSRSARPHQPLEAPKGPGLPRASDLGPSTSGEAGGVLRPGQAR